MEKLSIKNKEVKLEPAEDHIVIDAFNNIKGYGQNYNLIVKNRDNIDKIQGDIEKDIINIQIKFEEKLNIKLKGIVLSTNLIDINTLNIKIELLEIQLLNKDDITNDIDIMICE